MRKIITSIGKYLLASYLWLSAGVFSAFAQANEWNQSISLYGIYEPDMNDPQTKVLLIKKIVYAFTFPVVLIIGASVIVLSVRRRRARVKQAKEKTMTGQGK